MPTFVAVVVASLAGRIVYDALAPYGLVPLNMGLSLVVWVTCFSVCKSFLVHLRPDS